jgi:predicted PurR-regulated permease PerM
MGNVLVPRVMGHTLGVSPLTVRMGISVGSILDSLPGDWRYPSPALSGSS